MGEAADAADFSDHQLLAIWACDCADRVLCHFEAIRPGDDRPRKAIEAGRAWVRGKLPMVDAREAAFAAHAAARDAGDTAATAAARAAGHAAATAHVAGHARHAAAYAVTAAGADRAERDWQAGQLPARLQAGVFGTRTGKAKRA